MMTIEGQTLELRENNKTVIGVGVKQSTSSLFIGNCDEFIFYDDLVREEEKARVRVEKVRQSAPKPAPSDKKQPDKPAGDPEEAIRLVMETIDALLARGDKDAVWASHVKQAIRRLQPQFEERFYGFRSFSALLEAVQEHDLVRLEKKGEGGYLIRAVVAGEV